MRKLRLLQQHLAKSTALQLNEDQLHVSSDNGTFSSKPGNPNLYLKHKAQILLTDYVGSAEGAALVITQFLNQYEPDRPEDALTFEVDILDANKVDLQFSLPLTQRIFAHTQGDETTLTHCKDYVEPQPSSGKVTIVINDQETASWDASQAEPEHCDDCTLDSYTLNS